MFSKNLPSMRKQHRYDPFFSLQEEVKDLLNRFNDWSDFGDLTTSASAQFVPRVDVTDKDNQYLVTAEIPGMTEKDIKISLNENVLTLEGEKKSEYKDEGKGFWRSEISYGSFYRAVPFTDEVDENKVQASYRDGLLKVTLGKKEGAAKKTKRIEINTQNQIQ